MRDAFQTDQDHNSQENAHNETEEFWSWKKGVTEASSQNSANPNNTGEMVDDLNAVFSQYEALLQVKTTPEGFNSGRTYYIHADSEHHRDQVVQELTNAATKSLAKKLAASRFRSSQKVVRTLYESIQCQIIVGVLILTVSTLPRSEYEAVLSEHNF